MRSRKIIPPLLAVLLCSGCSIRMMGYIETEDAVYGKTNIDKDQKYDKQRDHLGFWESFMGTINSQSLDAVDRIVNGGSAPASQPTPEPVTVTPVPSGRSVIVQP